MNTRQLSDLKVALTEVIKAVNAYKSGHVGFHKVEIENPNVCQTCTKLELELAKAGSVLQRRYNEIGA